MPYNTEPLPNRYWVVEGTIGSGKSDLAKRLASHFKMHFFKECPEENPFLLRFYRNTAYLGFATQVAFLKQRIRMAHEIFSQSKQIGNTMILSDFLFEKDVIFTDLILETEELALYNWLIDNMNITYPTPNLVIYLQASEEVVKKRIVARGDSYEKIFPEGYLERIHIAYSDFFHHYKAAPQLIVNTDNLDFSDQEDFALLLKCIEEARGSRSYFNKS